MTRVATKSGLPTEQSVSGDTCLVSVWAKLTRVSIPCLLIFHILDLTDIFAEVQQQTQNKNGRWVRGQAEFSIALPINRLVGCNARWEDLTYNEPLPNEGTSRVPFDLTF
jgi:hypothetical protein